MFDVGFSELCLIGLVSLLVIGPERLPKVARLAGFWIGKTRSMVASVKEEIKLELHAEEMRQIFKEQSGLEAGARAITEAQQLLDETSDLLKSAVNPSLPTTTKTPESRPPSPPDNAEQHEPK